MYPKRSTTLKKKEGRKHTVPTHPSAVMVLALGIFKKHVGKGGRNTAWKVRKAKWQLAHGLEARDSGGKAGKFRKIQGGRWRGVVWVRGDGFHGEGHSLSLSLSRCGAQRWTGLWALRSRPWRNQSENRMAGGAPERNFTGHETLTSLSGC